MKISQKERKALIKLESESLKVIVSRANRKSQIQMLGKSEEKLG